MKKELTVFISDHCFNCKESLLIAQQIERDYPNVIVKLFNIDNSRPPAEVFAVPTYMLDGKVVSLGNPTEQQIKTLLTQSEPA